MDKVSKIGLTVTVLLLIGWFYHSSQQRREVSPAAIPAAAPEAAAPAPAAPAPVAEIAPPAESAAPGRPVVVPAPELPAVFPEDGEPVVFESEYLVVELSPFGGVIKELVLKENRAAGIRGLAGEGSGEVTMFSARHLGGAPGRLLNFPAAEMETARLEDGARFTLAYENRVVLEKSYSFSRDGYTGTLEITLRNDSAEPLAWPDGLVFGAGAIYPIDPEDLLGVDVLDGDNVLREKQPKERVPATVNWLGLKTKYFAAIFKPLELPASFFTIVGREKNPAPPAAAAFGCARGPGASPYEYLQASMTFPALTLQPGEEARYSFALYFGPADYEALQAAGHRFEKLVDFGFLGNFYIPQALIWLLTRLYRLLGSYGWAIIFLTVIIKVVLWPLTHKSYASMGKMQQLQPQLAELKEKYKGDAKKIQAETMKLYKANGVNPMGGCLPMLLQMPVLFALFTTLRNTILLRNAPFWIIPGRWIKDLSGPDVLATLEQSYPIIGNQVNILPLLMGISFYLQQKITPTAGGGSPQAAQQQKMMATLMPVMFTFLFYSLPAGLNLYFMLSTFITVGQQMMTTKLKAKKGK
ncbi:MAG: membrane protein insertase YidC [Candidatus Erginobacter occultus]|nr:membrane protein insertase YidC [Candidatus Erginobacter occultus]